MFVLDLDDGTQGAVAVDTKYREMVNREGVKPSHLPRFTEIHDRSGAFVPGAVDVFSKSLLALMWLEHVLLLSMLQHASGHWTWGRYVVVHPEGNLDTVRRTDEYRAAARRRRDVRVDDDGGPARGQGAHAADDRGAAPPLHRQVVHSVALDRGSTMPWSHVTAASTAAERPSARPSATSPSRTGLARAAATDGTVRR